MTNHFRADSSIALRLGHALQSLVSTKHLLPLFKRPKRPQSALAAQIEIKPEMIGYYLAEFSITYKPIRHGRAGLGATTNRFIPK